MNKITAVAVGAVAVLAAIFGVVAFTASSDEDASVEGASEFQNVVVTGEALPEFGKGETDPAIGMTAPVLEGFGFLGNEVNTKPG
ncbi:MAG: hypothetical protein RLZZ43_853, partial [Actinomycetota bacterium]